MDRPPRATVEGTARLRQRQEAHCAPDFYRETVGLSLSNIGLGTALGDLDPYTDALVADAVVRCVQTGINVVDTAINYRHQRAERCVGRGLDILFKSGAAARDEVLISTKGGYLPYDTWASANPPRFVLDEYILPGLLPEEELVGRWHCLNPDFLKDQIDRSLHNLGLESIDIYYLHHPEYQLDTVPRPELLGRLRSAFAMLEEAVTEGRIGIYGVASWRGFLVPPDTPALLSLAELWALAQEVGGETHHFRALQVPVNLLLNQAVSVPNQELEGAKLTLLQAAAKLGMAVFASGPLGQGHLTEDLPSEARAALPGLQSDAQRALQAARSVPGVACALAGMKRNGHLAENLALCKVPVADWTTISHLF